jgi:hypothetical protein
MKFKNDKSFKRVAVNVKKYETNVNKIKVRNQEGEEITKTKEWVKFL